MKFSHPALLFLLVIPVLLAAWELWRRGHRMPMPFDHVQCPAGSRLSRFIKACNLLPALLLALVIVILAGPQKPGLPEQQRVLTNIEFCLDVSGSMNSPYGEGSQYDAAMLAIADFTSRRKGDAFGLTIFGNEVLRWVPLTQDHSAIRMATPFLRPGKLPQQFGGTEIGKGLRACRKTLELQEEGDRLIILLTDGESADLGGNAPFEVAAELRAARIVVYIVYIGSTAPPEAMPVIASGTGGRVFSAGDPNALKMVFTHIDAMQPVRVKPTVPQWTENYKPCALAGLILLGLYQLTLWGLRFTPW